MRVQICGICEGTGELEERDILGDKGICKCSKCDGTGKLITGIYTYEVPFTKNKSLIYEADSKIINIVRELQKK